MWILTLISTFTYYITDILEISVTTELSELGRKKEKKTWYFNQNKIVPICHLRNGSTGKVLTTQSRGPKSRCLDTT